MKKILLASASLVAFAGVAAAEVSFTGSAVLGYNDNANTAGTTDNYYGFYWEGTVAATLETALDNGLTAGVTFNFEFIETQNANGGMDLNSDDIVVYVKSDAASLYFGDTKTAANKFWASAGDMESDGFTSDWTDGTGNNAVLRGDLSFGDVSASVSYTVAGTDNELDQLSIGAKGTFGAVTVVAAYEGEADLSAEAGDFNNDEIFGLSLATSFSGADFVLAYASDENSDSTGVKVTYPVGPVKLTAYYVSESVGDDNWGIKAAYAAGAATVTVDYQDDQGVAKTGVDFGYDVGNGLTIAAGYYDEDGWADAETYLAGSYDLGGGASLDVSYVPTDAEGDDEIGPNDYQLGTTVAVSFAF